MMAFITALVAACKTFNKLAEYIDLFRAEWVKYDIDRIGDAAIAKKQEFDALNEAMKRTTNDSERLALLRSIDRLK